MTKNAQNLIRCLNVSNKIIASTNITVLIVKKMEASLFTEYLPPATRPVESVCLGNSNPACY